MKEKENPLRIQETKFEFRKIEFGFDSSWTEWTLSKFSRVFQKMDKIKIP